jgi:3-oxoacyl-[acyl-carrier-protein] synthase-3
MNLPFNADESRALDVVRACVASKISPVPHDDAELVDSGGLDSMAWVDTLISIEAAMGIRDFGNPWPEDRSKTIRALADMVLESRRLTAREAPRADIRSAASADEKVSITGWASLLGSRQLSAEQIERDLDLPPHKIRDGAGIHRLCLAAVDEDELVLAQRASEIALEMAEISVEEIDFLVVTSATFLGFPSLAASLHARLLMPETSGALDVGGACAGLIYSFAVAKSLLAQNPRGVALVVASEVHSRRLSAPQVPGDFRGLFGDGACAFILTNSGTAANGSCISLKEFVWGCSGNAASSLRVRSYGDAGLTVQFKGEQRAHAAVAQLGRIIEKLENLAGQPRRKVDYFALHQPNPRVVAILAEKAGIPLERIPMMAKDCGNLGSVTCGAGLCQALNDFHQSGDGSRIPLIFMAAVAPGLVWGGTFLN